MLDQLEASGLREDTIVILMSDNGHSVEENAGITIDDHRSGYPRGHYYLAHGGGGNTGKWIGHKGTFFEGGIRVPAIISYPAKLPRGETRDQIVTIMDWLPTIVDLCGIEQGSNTPRFDGSSVIPILRDAKTPSPHETLHFAWSTTWAVRKGNWKLISKTNAKSGKSVISLHHLAESSPEMKDHVHEQPELVKELTALHEAWEKDVAAK